MLDGGGRLLAVAPNRRGIWARVDRTPFGHGHPYSTSQLSRMLRDNQFVPEQVARALYIPPTRSRFLLKSATAWERVGSQLFDRFAGVVMIEASKQLYQIAAARRQVRRRPMLIPLGGATARAADAASMTVSRPSD